MAKSKDEVTGKSKPPARSEDELQRMQKAYERRQGRHDPVTADISREENGRLALDVPHDDHRGWLIRLRRPRRCIVSAIHRSAGANGRARSLPDGG